MRDQSDPLHAAASDPTRRVPVIPLYRWSMLHEDLLDDLVEPCLSIGMLFAYARTFDGGRLEERYDLQRIGVSADRALERWSEDPVPAIFVFSDYIWNVDVHLEMSRRVKEISPASLTIHGGPSAPKYETDADAFFAQNPSVDVLVRGEGEFTFAEILGALDGRLDDEARRRLAAVSGLTFREADGAIVRTPERPRADDLSLFPSPYLTGEFDDLLERPWKSASIETNRGCPYGCTFCDWGSATLSRIRKFDLQRVLDELDWIMAKAEPSTLIVNDANFGIFARDVDITRHVAALKEQHPSLELFVISGLAKNTTKYTKEIVATMVDAGIAPLASSLAIQSVDEQTLLTVRRQNIRLDRYDQLAEEFVDRGLPVMTDLMVGLPGATVASFIGDLQHCFDRDITARMFLVRMLPNSPMNDPEYRSEHRLVVDEHGILVGCSSYDATDYARMTALRRMYRGADHFGVLRHLLRVVQWDHGVAMGRVLERIDQVVTDRGNRYPLLAFFARAFDLYTMAPVAWEPFFDEVAELLHDEFGIARDSGIDVAIRAQIALLPARNRTFPDSVWLEHDLVAYETDRQASGSDAIPDRPLTTYGPTELLVEDPTDVCARALRNDFPVRRDMESGNLYWVGYDWEMTSPLARQLHSNLALRRPVPA